MSKSARYWIDNLQLQKHPEGGWFKESYRSPEIIENRCLPVRFIGDRNYSTSIYFLLSGTEISAFHKIQQDELWYFHEGSAATIHVIDESGEYFRLHLGNDLEQQQQLQVIVKAGWLFAVAVDNSDGYSLVGCNVAPGFDFKDFKMPSRKQLIEEYPQHSLIIKQFSK